MNVDMENVMQSLAKKNAESYPPQPEDYVGEDGLLYCGKCRTPKQMKVMFLDREVMPLIPCKCRREELEKEESERKRSERQAMIAANRVKCFPDRRLIDWNFSNSDGDEPVLVSMKKYCGRFADMLRDGCGLILYGEVGVGKTFAAACVANELIDKGYKVYMTDFLRIINTLWGMNQGRQDFLDGLNRYDLLIIDDLAAERNTEYANEIVMNVIDTRCKSGKPMIVTTNLTAEELFDPADNRKKRIYSRLCEMCIPVRVTATKDRRKMKMSENYGKYKDLLGV